MLKIHAVSLEVVRRLGPVVVELGRYDRDLADQLKRARTSIPLNLSEGSQSSGRRRNQHYGYAKGSAQETIGILDTAVACGYITSVPDDVMNLLRQIVGTLVKIVGIR